MTFDMKDAVARATEAWLAANTRGVPVSIRKPVSPESGPCVECKHDTENVDDGDFICEGCLEESRESRREDERLDDPRHVPYGKR